MWSKCIPRCIVRFTLGAPLGKKGFPSGGPGGGERSCVCAVRLIYDLPKGRASLDAEWFEEVGLPVVVLTPERDFRLRRRRSCGSGCAARGRRITCGGSRRNETTNVGLVGVTTAR